MRNVIVELGVGPLRPVLLRVGVAERLGWLPIGA